MPLELTQSPGAQSYQMPQTGEDEDEIFKKGFRDLAYTALGKAMPELMAQVLTFRPIDVSAKEGRGIGTFVVMHGDNMIDVPVVISDNAVKPLDMFYSKRTNQFGPLSADFLRNNDKGTLPELGSPSARPTTLRTDRPILSQLPPSTSLGRTVLASANDGRDWYRSVQADDGHGEPKLAFVALIGGAPNNVKTAYERFFAKHPAIRRRAVEVYGKTAMSAMFARSTKTAASAETPVKHDVFLMTASTPIQEAKRELGAETSAAYKAVALQGFYVKDRRKKTADLFALAERPVELVEPSSPGVYRVYLRPGRAVEALIVPNPIVIRDETRYVKCDSDRTTSKSLYLVVLKDGRAAVVSKILAEALGPTSVRDVREFLKGRLGSRPTKQNGYGFLVSTSGLTVRATDPFWAGKVMDDNGIVEFSAGYDTTAVLDSRLRGNSVLHNGKTFQFSADFEWADADDPYNNRLTENSFLQSQGDVLRAVEGELLRRGATPVEVKTASGGFLVGGAKRPLPYAEALVKVARDYDASIADAEAVLKLATARDRSSVWVMKRAAEGPPPDEQQDPNAQAGMDPMAMAQMMGPPQPAPTDLAIAEQVQMVQNQMAALQQQLQMLQTVQMRTQQISMGGGAMAAPMGAASMMGGPAMGPGGMPAMAPVGMDPSMMGMMQPGMMQPGMDPSMMGGDPSMMGAQQAAPPPMMTEDPTPENIASQINPAFLDAAASLQQADVFDAAAIASLAQQPNLSALTQAYVPNLTRALDNVARILLLFYIHEADIKEQIGGDDYTTTEQRLRDVLEGLGEVLVKIEGSASQITPSTLSNG